MKIGITGAAGLLGFHIRACLHSQAIHELSLADRDTFSSSESLDSFVRSLDVLVHCAGMNRGDDAEVEQVNIQLAESLVGALERTSVRPILIYANSTHAEKNTGYGRGKRSAGELLENWAKSNEATVYNVILPHVFGEFGKPFYNSVVSTFCHQLANDNVPRIDVDGQLELVHAQTVAKYFIELMSAIGAQVGGSVRLSGRQMRVSEMLGRLQSLWETYRNNIFPDLREPIDLQLFNTLRSYLYPAHYPQPLKLHTDARGDLFEAVKCHQGGQTFISSTHPTITRGNHFHLRKVERFLVLNGDAEIRLRKIFSDDVRTLKVSGRHPAFVDIPTFHTHSITNTGQGELVTLFWTNEIFDPENTDTYFEAVNS